jgi:transposase-like protein
MARGDGRVTYRQARIATSQDRWTCPDCQVTVVVTANQPDTRWCLRAAMHRHGLMHQAEREASK